MSLNDIKLPDFIIDELYKDTLVVSPALSMPAVPAPAAVKPATPAQPAPATTAKPTATPAKPVEPAAPSAKPAAPAAISAAPADPANIKILGKNARRFTILVHSPGSAFLPDDQLSFLTKILEACRMNIGDVAIVNTATAPVTISELKQQLRPENILLFGIEPTAIRLPINFPAFRPQPYDHCTYLSAPTLNLLVQPSEESRLLKSKLWVCLKSLFNV